MFGLYTMSIALGKTFHMIFTSISLENITKSSSNNNNNNCGYLRHALDVAKHAENVAKQAEVGQGRCTLLL